MWSYSNDGYFMYTLRIMSPNGAVIEYRINDARMSNIMKLLPNGYTTGWKYTVTKGYIC